MKPMEIRHDSQYSEIILAGELKHKMIPADLNLLNQLADKPVNLIVNCEQLSALEGEWIKNLIKLYRRVKDSQLQIYYVGFSAQLKKQIEREGLGNAFPQLTDKRSAIEKITGVVPVTTGVSKLDVNYVNPFISATINVLEMQASVKSTQKSLYFKKSGESIKDRRDISGIIGVVSNGFTGSVIISFSEPTFLGLMSKMLGEECKTLSPEITDGAGELINIIFGQAKKELNEKGYGIKMALPNVVTGSGHGVFSQNSVSSIVVLFDSDVGDFFIEIGMQ